MSKIPDYCGPGGSDKRYVKQEDSFELIRRYAYKMHREGKWTLDEMYKYIEEEDAKLEAEEPVAEFIPDPPRTSFPDQGHWSNGVYKNGDGSISEPRERHIATEMDKYSWHGRRKF